MDLARIFRRSVVDHGGGGGAAALIRVSHWGVTVRPGCRLGVRVPWPGGADRGGQGCGCSAGDGEDPEPVQGVGDQPGPGCYLGEVEQDPSTGPGECGRHGEESEPEPFRFPPAGLMIGEGEHLHPGGEFGGQHDDGAPDLVLGEVVQRQVHQPGVFADPDAVFGAGPAAVPQLQIGELATGGVGGERGDPESIDVGQPQLRAGMGSFLSGDDPHPAGQPTGPIGR